MYEALYIHIPFCKQRCAYCDFTTEALAGSDERMGSYLDSLLTTLRASAREGSLAQVRTLYIGGGTPTHFGHGRLVELCYALSLGIKLEQVEEYTVEANPESLTLPLVRDLYALGVSRLSLGVQSFVDTELATLGRIHTGERAKQALGEARERFDNISIDLMCGIPGQTLATWQYSLEQALALEPEHLSVYALQNEEGTPLTQALEKGALQEIDADVQADMLLEAARMLGGGGYERYEVASYAKPGKASKHNTAYWTGVSYLGVGHGASSMKTHPDGSRERWQHDEGETPELLTAEEALAEDLMLAMRMSAGPGEELYARAKSTFPKIPALFEELQQLGLLEQSTGTYRPTQKGWLLGNELYARIWNLAQASCA